MLETAHESQDLLRAPCKVAIAIAKDPFRTRRSAFKPEYSLIAVSF